MNKFPRIFLEQLFVQWESEGIPYAVLRDYQDLPGALSGGDLDIVVRPHSVRRAEGILLDVAQSHDLRRLMRVPYGSVCLSMFFGWCNREFRTIRIDINHDQEWWGTTLLPAQVILNSREKHNGVWVACRDHEAFLCWIGPLLGANMVKAKRIPLIRQCLREAPEEFARLLARLIGARATGKVMRELLEDVGKTGRRGRFIRWRLLARQCLAHPWDTWRKAANYARDALTRRLHPPGMFVAVLGTDGAGKSTMIEEASRHLFAAFTSKQSQVMHLRPGLLPPIHRLLKPWDKQVCAVVTNPHGSKPSGRIGSLLRLFYYYMDYVVGYWVKVRPPLVHNSIVLFDRYCYDYWLDPRRARLSLPQWLIRLFMWLVPKPGLILCLGAEPEVIYTRKPELPLEEVRKQVGELRRFCEGNPRAVWIDTGQPIETCVYQSLVAIMDRMASRCPQVSVSGG